MTIYQSYRKSRTRYKFLVWVIILASAYTLSGFFLLPMVVRHYTVKHLALALNRDVALERVRINPLAMSITLEGLSIKEKDEARNLFSLKSLYANVESSSIIRLAPVLKELRIDQPDIFIRRISQSGYSISDLLDFPAEPPATAEKPSGTPVYFAVSNIQILNGNAQVEDQFLDKKHAMQNVTLTVPFISNMENHVDIFVEPLFDAMLNGSHIRISGKSKPFTPQLSTEVDLAASGIDLHNLSPYLPEETGISNVAGLLDMAFRIVFSQTDTEGATSTLSGNLDLTGFTVQDLKHQPLFSMEKMSLALSDSSLLRGKINVSDLSVVNPTLFLTQQADGNLNVMSLSRDVPPEPPSDKQVPSHPMTINLNRFHLDRGAIDLSVVKKTDGSLQDAGTLLALPEITLEHAVLDSLNRSLAISSLSTNKGRLDINRLKSGKLNIETLAPPAEALDTPPVTGQPPAPPWTITVKEVDVNGFSVDANGLAGPGRGKVLLEGITINARDFSSQPETRFPLDIDLSVNTTGKLKIKGQAGIKPLSADLAIDLSAIALNWAQPFITDYLNLIISGGTLETRGNLIASIQDAGGADMAYKGDAAIRTLGISEKDQGNEILRWEALNINGMDMTLSPMRLAVNEIIATRPYGFVEINREGAINLMEAVNVPSGKEKPGDGTEEALSPPIPGAEDRPLVEVKSIRVDNGSFLFHDRSITPDFKASLTDINAQVSGLSSNENETASVNLDASLNKAPFGIKGTINPLGRTLLMDMGITCRSMGLVPMTAYSGKYAGYNIQKGNLSLDLNYAIRDRKLDSTNKVFLDQFNFGEKVESPDAIKAPVTLAVSLLKDPSGRITLDLPVRGSFDDPEFSIGGIIVKMIMNLLAKAATAPFSLLGAMFGGGDDLNILAFEPGSQAFTEETSGKLETLVKALTQRPGLNIDVTGYSDPAGDTEALTEEQFERRIRTARVQELADSGIIGSSMESVALSPEDRQRIVTRLYSALPGAVIPEVKEAEPPSTAPMPGQAQPGLASPDPKQAEPVAMSMEEMEQALKATIQITGDDLKQLAQDRAQAVIDFFIATGGIDPKRIFMVDTSSDKSVSAQNLQVSSSVVLTIK